MCFLVCVHVKGPAEEGVSIQSFCHHTLPSTGERDGRSVYYRASNLEVFCHPGHVLGPSQPRHTLISSGACRARTGLGLLPQTV